MARPNLLSKSLPRVELDHRARDARARLVRLERLLVPRALVVGFRLSPLIRLLGARAGGNGRRGGWGSGSQSDSRLGCMRETDAAWLGAARSVACVRQRRSAEDQLMKSDAWYYRRPAPR
jgi:hypothetical protein